MGHKIKAFLKISALIVFAFLMLSNSAHASESSSLQLKGVVYELEETEDYSSYVDHSPVNQTAYGEMSLGTVSLLGDSIYKAQLNNQGIDTYVVKGNLSFKYLFNTEYEKNNPKAGDWYIETDTPTIIDNVEFEWEKKEKSNGIILVENNEEDKSWFYKDCFNSGNISEYALDCSDLDKGIHYRVIVTYKMFKKGTGLTFGEKIEEESKKYIEIYEFYVFRNIDANEVVLSNLSSTSSSYAPHVVNDIYEISNTGRAGILQTEAYTRKGFSVRLRDNSDIDSNPGISYSILKDGKVGSKTTSDEYKDPGKYEVIISDSAGNEKLYTIYVDTRSDEEIVKEYLETFLQGTLLYTDKEYPVYSSEGVSYILNLPDNCPPIHGEFREMNSGFGKNIEFSQNPDILDTPGEYVAELIIGDDTGNNGDYQKLSLHFEISSEEAYLPAVNIQKLTAYTDTGVFLSYPVFYGVRLPSTGMGYFILAYDSIDAACEDAEKHGITISPEELYLDPSAFTLFADIGEEEIDYYDVSSEMYLESDVIVYANSEQKALLTKHAEELLPIINDRSEYYLGSGKSINEREIKRSFEFVRDPDGRESNSITVTDSEGKEFQLEYNRSAAQQLKEQGCATGIITIHEENLSNGEVEYNAVFFNRGDNTAQITLGISDGAENSEVTVTIGDSGQEFEAEAFTINAIDDLLDPYSVVVMSMGGQQWIFTRDKISNEIWTEPGEYFIKAINRLGYDYSFTVSIPGDEKEAVIEDEIPDGTEDETEVQSEETSVEEAVDEVVSQSDTADTAVDEVSEEETEELIEAEAEEPSVQDDGETAEETKDNKKGSSAVWWIVAGLILILAGIIIINKRIRTSVLATLTVIVRLIIPNRKK